MNALWFDRHKLASALQERLASSRRDAHKVAHQMYLFEPQALVTTSTEAGFRFHERAFEGVRFQRAGQMRFGKHFLGPDRVPAFDGKADGEEMQCAFALDSLDAVEFWLRNVPQHADAFSLPLAKGRFYPDFIAKLKDGRVFVVEYKGGDRVDLPDSDNKRNIGDVWEKAGGGLFLMVEKMKHGLDMRAQLKAKLEG
jgi:type III restriction enzyme